MLGYVILFETEDAYYKVGNLVTTKNHVDTNMVRAALKKYVSPDVAKLDPDEVYNMVLGCTDGKELQNYDLDPADFWPLVEKDKSNDFYQSEGGDKN